MPRIKTHRRKKHPSCKSQDTEDLEPLLQKMIEKFHPRVHGEGKDKSIALEYKNSKRKNHFMNLIEANDK